MNTAEKNQFIEGLVESAPQLRFSVETFGNELHTPGFTVTITGLPYAASFRMRITDQGHDRIFVVLGLYFGWDEYACVDKDGCRVDPPRIRASLRTDVSEPWKRIGRDIGRRFVPKYVARADLCHAKAKNAAEHTNGVETTLRDLKVAFGPDAVVLRDLSSLPGHDRFANSNTLRCREAVVEVSASDSVTVKVDLDRESAIAFALFFKTIKGNG